MLAFFSLFTTNNVSRLDNPAQYVKVLAVAAIISNLLWVGPWLIVIWELIGSSWTSFEWVWQVIWAFTLLSICLTLTGSFLSMKRTSTAFAATRLTAIASAWLLYVYVLPGILRLEFGYLGETWQFLAILSIIFAFSAISAPIIGKLKPAKRPANDDDAYRERIRAELRAEVEAEVRAELARELTGKQK